MAVAPLHEQVGHHYKNGILAIPDASGRKSQKRDATILGEPKHDSLAESGPP